MRLLRPPQTLVAPVSPRCSRPFGGPCPQHSGTTESSFTISHRLGHEHDLLPKFDYLFVPSPSRQWAYGLAEPPTRPPRRPATGRRGQLRERAIREVAVREVTGRLTDVVEDLDLAVQVALAEGPHGTPAPGLASA